MLVLTTFIVNGFQTLFSYEFGGAMLCPQNFGVAATQESKKCDPSPASPATVSATLED
jgi:hypothetical protein